MPNDLTLSYTAKALNKKPCYEHCHLRRNSASIPAFHLFQTGRLTLGYASQLAQMPPNAFRQLLKQRNIPLYFYDIEDLELDLKNLQELG